MSEDTLNAYVDYCVSQESNRKYHKQIVACTCENFVSVAIFCVATVAQTLPDEARSKPQQIARPYRPCTNVRQYSL